MNKQEAKLAIANIQAILDDPSEREICILPNGEIVEMEADAPAIGKPKEAEYVLGSEEQIVVRSMRECCRLYCTSCSRGAWPGRISNDCWMHGLEIECHASPIYELMWNKFGKPQDAERSFAFADSTPPLPDQAARGKE